MDPGRSSISAFMRTTTRLTISGLRIGRRCPAHMVRLGKEDNFWEHGIRPVRPLLRDIL